MEDDSEDAVDAINFCQQKGSAQRGHNQSFHGNNQGSSNTINRGNPYTWRNPNQQNQGNNVNRNKQICVFCKIPNHRQEECRKRINANSTPVDAHCGRRSMLLQTTTKVKPTSTNPGPPGFSVLSLMEPLCQALLVIPQIIMSLCAISITTCNKLCEIMMPFHGDKK
jgi:hypothetical protein